MPVSMSKNFIIYLILLALHIGLVWWLPYFPTQDGPSHLYNLVILRDLLNGGKEWGAFYTHHLHPVPNLAFEAISYPLLKIFHPLVVEKIFISLYMFLLGASLPLFLRTFGRSPFPLSFLALPVVFNFTLMMGFYSFVLAVPLFLIGASLAWKCRNCSPICQFFVFNSAGMIIFFAHLIPFICFIMFLFAMLLAEIREFRHFFAKAAKLTTIISPSLLCFLFYILAGQGNSNNSQVVRVTMDYLCSDLFFFSTVTFTPLQMVPAYLFLNLIIIGAYMSFKHFSSNGWRFTDSAPEKRTLLIFLIILVVIYFFMPFRFGGGSYFNERLPWVILLTSLPLLFLAETQPKRNFIAFAGIIITVLFWSCNVVVFSHQSKIVKEYLHGLKTGLPGGAFVMTYKTKDAGWSRADVLAHAASYYGIYNGCVDVGNYEAGLPYFPVQFRKTLPTFPSLDQITYEPAKINWPLYPCIRFLFGWDLDTGERIRLGYEFHIIREEGRLTVWQRNPVPQRHHYGIAAACHIRHL
jgi:hypothetical protein